MVGAWCGRWGFLLATATVAVRTNAADPPKPNPTKPENYVEWFNQTNAVPEADDAHSDYLEVYSKWNMFIGNIDKALKGPWTDLPTVEGWLAGNQAGMAKFRSAAAKPGCFFPLRTPPSGEPRQTDLLFRVEFPKYSIHLNIAQAFMAEGYQALRRGETKTLIENSKVVLRGARHIEGNLTLMGRLTADRCATLAYAGLRNAMRYTPNQDAADVIREWAASDPQPKPLGTFLRTEQIILWDVCQRLFVPGSGDGGWRLDEAIFDSLVQQLGTRGLKADDRTALTEIGYDATLRELNDYFAAVQRWCELPYPDAAKNTESINRLVQDSKNPLLRVLLPTVGRTRALYEGLNARRNATYLIAHLHAFRGRKGAYPESLSELPAEDVARWRMDPFSAAHFVYKKLGEGFTLYSVAENEMDDGGKHSESMKDGDYVFWPVQDKQ
jgi:hypothetical protein